MTDNGILVLFFIQINDDIILLLDGSTVSLIDLKKRHENQSVEEEGQLMPIDSNLMN